MTLWNVIVADPGQLWERQSYTVQADEKSEAIQQAKAHAKEDGAKKPIALKCTEKLIANQMDGFSPN